MIIDLFIGSLTLIFFSLQKAVLGSCLLEKAGDMEMEMEMEKIERWRWRSRDKLSRR